MWRTSLPNGFTLMEVLITVGIVAILSASTITLIGRAPQQGSRDNRRMADLASIASAINLFRNDKGTYPTCGGAANCTASSMHDISTYMPLFPSDPKVSEGRQYIYQPKPSGCNATTTRCTSYQLCAAGERSTTHATDCPANCGGTFTCSLIVSGP